ncbi:MAG: porphobilinogen synthase [Desulfovibrio sp.]|nr:porphobilinogen synthase [Desulfovibrio sp.]
MSEDFFRGRRLRRSRALRNLCRQTNPIQADKLIMPYFVVDNGDPNYQKEIPSMPGQYQLGLESLLKKLDKSVSQGLANILLFGLPKTKDDKASEAYAEDGVIQKAVRRVKQEFPDLLVITDLCLCEYMSHGHCGILNENGLVENDPTLPLLARTAVSQARAGADIIAPSDMMDGRVKCIREALDEAGFSGIPVMSYAVKYASAFYGPFREAAESAPACGDRKSYQMDPANAREALLEAWADLDEGADILIVKPASAYQDIIKLIRDNTEVPLAAYQVSGEYSLIKAASANGWVDGEKVTLESLIGLKRSGADMIITYFAEELLAKALAQR